ncbi:MAG: DNA-directed RNA polymerase subunit alpha [Holosporales bacterium]|jgi:DNA-directed RNA polymerase subunit alpha|nr:DNA-directed RNA polymerase subunit alpha [Holosporales bacterium]
MINKHWESLIRPYKMQTSEVEGQSDRVGSVVAEPMERGFGLTLGNALRRVLLSSLSGAAVTSIKIDGVLHEFSTIPGVIEDVTDIVLNVKSMAITMDGTSEKKIKLSVKGPCKVTAGMFEAGYGIKILDPDHHICTVGEGGQFSMEATVASGRGYVPANENKSEDMPIGHIAIDALYSPVKRVVYKVENARVGQVTDYDRLIMKVETNGSIKPIDAVAVAARILQDQLKRFVNFNDPMIDDREEKSAEDRLNPNLLRLIDELELSVRSMNCLKSDNVVYIGDLVHKTEGEMLKTPNFGRKSLNEIKDTLSQMGLHLGMEVPGWPPENIEEAVKKSNSGY